MDSGNGVVQIVQVPLIQRQLTAVQNIDLAAVEHLHAVQLPRGIAEVPEVNRVNCPGNAGGVFRNADQAESPPGRLRRQLPDGAEGVAAEQRVHMYVRNKWFHNRPSPPPILYRKATESSVAFHHFALHEAQHQGQQNPDNGDPLGGHGQSMVQTALLILTQIRFGSAGNRSGQASLLAGLHQHDHDQRNAAQSLQNNQNRLQNTHYKNLPPPDSRTQIVNGSSKKREPSDSPNSIAYVFPNFKGKSRKTRKVHGLFISAPSCRWRGSSGSFQ